MLDKWLRDFVHCDFRIGKMKIAFLDILLAVCVTFAAVQVRIPVFDYIETAGAEHTLKFMYCGLDFVLAVLVAFFTWKVTGSRQGTVGMYALTVIWPVFAGNSALNGGGEVKAAVMVMILLCICAWKKLYSLNSLCIVTGAVCVFQILQAEFIEGKLTNFWPNIYTLFSETGYVAEYSKAGKLFTFGVLLILFYYLLKKKPQVTAKLMLTSGLFFSLLISFIHPFMNYRSGYLANLFALLLFAVDRKKFYVPMILCIISYVSYSYYYNGVIGIFFWIYALAVLALTFDAAVYLYKQLHTGNE